MRSVPHRRPVIVTAAAMVASVLGSACSREVPAPIGLDGRLVAKDFRFTPSTLVVVFGRQSSILFENEDKVTHSFSYAGSDGDRDVPAGGSRRIPLNIVEVPEDLTTTFTCRFHGFEGMRGTIRIRT